MKKIWQSMGLHCMLLLLITGALVFFYACNKHDHGISHESTLLSAQFFTTSQETPEPVKKVVQFIQKENERYNYIDQFASKEGFAIWDKSTIIPANNGHDTAILIPLVLQNKSYTSSFILARINNQSIALKFVRGCDYREYGFGQGSDTLNANYIATTLMRFNSKIFGDTVFSVSDRRIFNSPYDTTYFALRTEKKTISNQAMVIPGSTEMKDPCITLFMKSPPDPNYMYVVQGSSCVKYPVDPVTNTNGNGTTGSGGIGGGSGSSGSSPGNSPLYTPVDNNNPNSPQTGNANPCIDSKGMPIPGCVPGTYTKVTDPPVLPVTKPSVADIENATANMPFALYADVPCEVLKQWLAIAQYQAPQSLIDKLNKVVSGAQDPITGGFTVTDIARVQKINDASSKVVNMDYFPVKITTLPTVNGVKMTPESLLQYIRKNINSFVDTDESEFTPYNAYGVDDQNLWNSDHPFGSIISIRIWIGLNNGSVITTYSDQTKWTFTTIHDPYNGDHPVSGNRDFGFTANPDGSYTFYTKGVDRLTDLMGATLQETSGVPFNHADALWNSFQDKIEAFVNTNKGVALKQNYTPMRPKWQEVKDVLDGKKPVSTLQKDCN